MSTNITERLIRGIESIALPAIADGTAAKAELRDLLDDALYPTSVARAEHLLALCADGETTEEARALRAVLRIGTIRALRDVVDCAKAAMDEVGKAERKEFVARTEFGANPNTLQEYTAYAVRMVENAMLKSKPAPTNAEESAT